MCGPEYGVNVRFCGDCEWGEEGEEGEVGWMYPPLFLTWLFLGWVYARQGINWVGLSQH